LTVHGLSASRPFTFTASGTNGPTITATFQLQDGSTVLSNAVFPPFTLGTTLAMIIPAGVALTSESGPVNGVIDPGETVTLLFGLRNANGTNTANLVATLVATNGITSPSAPQNYGVLTVHGPSASRPFTFTASGSNGQTITATLQLADGSTVRSNAIFSFTLGKTPASYSNNTAVIINDFNSATPYPSAINISNLNGLVTQVTVTLANLSHTHPRDINVLLVSPTAQKSCLMAECGGDVAINNTTLTFDDTTANLLPQFTQIASGTYRPTFYALTWPLFPAPSAPFPTNATAPPYDFNLSVFNNTSPNGAWALYVFDDQPLFSGSIANGWILRLNLTGPVPGAADLALGMTASALTNVATSNLTYTITVTNFGPSSAANVVVVDTLPGGAALVSASPTQGTVTNAGGLVTWSVGSLAKDATAKLTLVVQTGAAGTITNSATVTTATADPNPDDDTASVKYVCLQSPVMTGLQLTNGTFQMRVDDVMQPGTLVIEASTNLAGWAPVFTNTTPTNVLFYTDPEASTYLWRFYRAFQFP
jgi:uncharacterized repeat protein (TIGR01451 family)